ncbi:hypothetical protein [Thioclava nitratireducens]|uniref:hypothetical protein n=1 Tax=Thioclava nitratireducens TaxID=1915078 RepID=UPI002481832F|nr:hypothetical protein [Thioclava nitratireducens]WGT52616.1 hypothetical protein P0N61_20210 [Thioclava nitratireducens]
MHHQNIPVARILMSEFLTENRQALREAATLLGGPQAARRVAALTRDLAQPTPISRTLWRQLQWVSDLLTLELVDDLDSLEAGYFADLDPNDPVVEEICLLTDQYTDRLADLQAEERADTRQSRQAA